MRTKAAAKTSTYYPVFVTLLGTNDLYEFYNRYIYLGMLFIEHDNVVSTGAHPIARTTEITDLFKRNNNQISDPKLNTAFVAQT